MPDDTFDIDPGTADGKGTPALPKEIEGKSAAEIWAMVEAEKARATEALKGKERAEAIAQEIAMAALEGRKSAGALAPTPTPAAAEPNREEDPEGWIAHQVKKQVETVVKPLTEAYQKDRTMVMGGMADTARQRVAAQFADFPEHAKEIDEFLNNYPAEVRATPGAVEEAYYRVKGRAVTRKEQETSVRNQAAMESRGRTGGGEPETRPKVSEEQLRIGANLGLSADDYAIVESSGRMDIDEYLAAKAKAKTGAGGNHAAR